MTASSDREPDWDSVMEMEAESRRDDAVAFYRALSSEQAMGGIAAAVEARDFEAVMTLLKVLAVKDPHQAEIVYTSMLAVLDTGRSAATGGSGDG